jgi:signal transduction histidine kinase
MGTVHPARHLDHGVPIINNFERTGTVLVGSMIDSSLTGVDDRFLKSVTRAIVGSTAAAALIALLVGLLFASRITRPLGVLALAAKRVATGDLSTPVPVVGKDEVADLSSSFNEMTAELKRLDAAKKQVIADSAHELRTPVTLIQGIVEGMIDGVFPRDEATLESVYEETVRLSRLIDTLRELEIIESGELELSREGVDLRETIQKALLLFAPGAAAKSLTLSFESAQAAPSIVSGDYLRLGEVIYNLISNAIKYTQEGGAVLVREHAGESDFVAFSVEDSGPGIPIEERSHIFERFYRIDKSRAAETGGRGLGLAIAAEIVKAHGGSVSVGDSSLGGARFTVTLKRFVA